MYFHGDHTPRSLPISMYSHLKISPLWETSPTFWLTSSETHHRHHEHTCRIQWGSVRRVYACKGKFISRGKNSVLYKDNMEEWKKLLVLHGNNFSIFSCLFFSTSFIIPNPISWNICGRQRRTACSFGSQFPPVPIFHYQGDKVEHLLDWNKK